MGGTPGRSPQVWRKVTQAHPNGHGRFAGLTRECQVFLRRISGRFFERRICACSDFTRRNSLDLAPGYRLCGLFGAPSRTTVPALRGRDQPRCPPATSENSITMGSVAVVLPLRLGGSETARAGLGAVGSACRSRFWIPLGRSGLRECPDFLLAFGPSASEG